MPARAPRSRRLPARLNDPVADLRQLVLALTPDELGEFCVTLDPADLSVVEGILAEAVGVGWRRSPSAMAAHLDPTVQRWRYVELLSDKLVEAIDGTDTRQVWNLPSQLGKTSILCTWGVPWILQRNPKLRIMYVTYDADKAVEEGGKARDFITDHPELGVRLRADRKARGMWRTPEGGGLYAVGVLGGITGWPVDVMLLDDLMAGWQAAHSEAKREAVWSIYRSQIRMRLQGRSCPIVSAATRWHEDDPSGRMLHPPDVEGAEQWTHVRLPAIAEAPSVDFPDPDPLDRAPGEIIEPERFDLAEVQARAATLGPYLAAGLEQQRPAPEAGNELMRAWFQLDEQLPVAPDQAITSWDLKMKNKQSGDYVVGQTWWRVGGSYWLVDQLRGQWDHAMTADAIALTAVRHPEVQSHVVEAAGSADEVLPELRKARPGYSVSDEIAGALGMNDVERGQVETMRRRGMTGLLPEPVTDGAKPVRARAFIAPAAAAGDVHLPAAAAWVPHLLDEIASFPNGAHDDQVDAMSQALKKLAHGDARVSSGAGKARPATTMQPAGANAKVATLGGGSRVSTGAGRRTIGRPRLGGR